MFKAVGSTLAAVTLVAFMVRDRTWDDPATVAMSVLLAAVALWMWRRFANERRSGDAP